MGHSHDIEFKILISRFGIEFRTRRRTWHLLLLLMLNGVRLGNHVQEQLHSAHRSMPVLAISPCNMYS